MSSSNLSYNFALLSVWFFRLWHATLFVLGLLGLVTFIVLVIKFGQEEKLIDGVFVFSILILTSALYYRIANYLLRTFKKNQEKPVQKLISIHLFLLFILDAASSLRIYLKGSTSSKSIHLGMLELISGSDLESIYLSLFQHLPFIYSLLKPQLNGSILLVLGFYLLHLSRVQQR